jgi:hypothetical protein
MTGWLTASGIALVLLASLYTGLASSRSTEGGLAGDLRATATREAIDAEDDGRKEDQTTVPPQATATPADRMLTPTPAQILNRQDCEKVRGTDYFSPEERTWFLNNCVRR